MRSRLLFSLALATALAAPAALHAQSALAPVPIAPLPLPEARPAPVAEQPKPVEEAPKATAATPGSKLSDDEPAAPSARHFGISYGAGPGVLAIDLEIGHFYGFASTPLPLDVFVGDSFAAAALGLGANFKMGDPRWAFDVWLFGIPAHNTSMGIDRPNTMLAFGLGAGFHFTGTDGFMVGMKFPVIGTTISMDGHSFLDPSERALMFYMCSFLTLPSITVGYRF